MFSENDDFHFQDLDIFGDAIGRYDDWNFNVDVVEPSWKEKPMQQWLSYEVQEFVRHETSHLSTFIDLKRFECISGYIFYNLSKENCQALSYSTEIGNAIFDAKENYIRNELCGRVDSDLERKTIHSDGDENNSNKINYDTFTEMGPKRPKLGCKTRRKNSEKRSAKLWEFLLNLLNDAETCPAIIKWENFEEGTFRFVKSDIVARIWGNRKHNENMNYEKFTRAIRYYYKSQVLLPVPGKRRVYKFGPHAKGWSDSLPIY